MIVGESVAKGFAAAKKSLGLISIVFVFSLIFNLLNIFLAPKGADPNQPPPPPLIIAGVVFLFLTIYFQAGTMVYLRDLMKMGGATLTNFISGGRQYYLRMLLLGLVVSLIIGVFVLLAALSVGFFNSILPVLSIPFGILFAALGIYFVIMLFFAPYVVVVEEKSVKDSIGISMKLVKPNILPLLGIALFMIAIGFGIGLALGALLAGVSILVKTEIVTQVAFAIVSSFVNAFLGVVVTAAFMHFYLSITNRNNTQA